MKFNITNNKLTAQAETKADNLVLLDLMKGDTSHTPVASKKKHKKHVFKKTCYGCGKLCKGNIGLGIHQAKCLKAKVARDPSKSSVAHVWGGAVDTTNPIQAINHARN